MDDLSNSEETDEFFMRKALEYAAEAAEAGEVPVGAVAVLNGKIISGGGNRVEGSQNAVSHAEINVITGAAAAVGGWRLDDVTIYVTKEPCAMCAGAMVNARVARVVYGMSDPRSGCAGSALDVTGFPGMLHQVKVTGGVLEKECRLLIQDFFRKVRSK